MKWFGIMGLMMGAAALMPVAADAAEGGAATGKVVGSGDGYEIRLVPPGAVALVNASAPIQRLLAPAGAATKAPSLLAPPASATGGVFLVSNAASPPAITPPDVPALAMEGAFMVSDAVSRTAAARASAPASASSTMIYLNREPGVIVYPGITVVGQRGIALSGTLVYAHLSTGEKTSFLVDAGEVLSAVADDHTLYVLKSVAASEVEGTSPVVTATTRMVLTAQPLSKSGDVVSVPLDRAAYAKGIPLPVNINLTIKDGVIIVGSLDRYTFDGKAFKEVH